MYILFDYPKKTVTHQILSLLEKRKELTVKESATLNRFDSGYKGEVRFAELLHQHLANINGNTPLFSINLEMNGSESQFDCIYLTHRKLYHFEVKNYQGDFYIKDDKWFHRSSEKEIKNPLHQLHRGHILLKEFLLHYRINIPIESLLVFIHPAFHLYQSRMQDPIIFNSQLPNFIKSLQSLSSAHQNSTNIQLQNALTQAHKDVSKYDLLPDYDYHSLEKGVYCKVCSATINKREGWRFHCSKCGYIEPVKKSLHRHIHVFQLLFPELPLSVKNVYDWCGGFLTKRQIRYYLSNHYTLIKRGRSSFYMHSK